jgi:hypothetical protein
MLYSVELRSRIKAAKVNFFQGFAKRADNGYIFFEVMELEGRGRQTYL